MAWARANMQQHDRSGRAKRSAEARRCPKCKRGSALSHSTIVRSWDGGWKAQGLLECRWQDCRWIGTFAARKTLLEKEQPDARP